MPLNLAVGADKNNTKASKEQYMAESLLQFISGMESRTISNEKKISINF